MSVDALSESNAGRVSRAFCAARQSGVALHDYPGTMPVSLAEAYAIQDAAIQRWPDQLVGWKVARIADEYSQAFGSERLAGPIFRKAVFSLNDNLADERPAAFEFIPQGFSAVEAELVFVLGKDAPPEQMCWSVRQAMDLVQSVCPGVELAGSPFPRINEFGPAVTISDFGNNMGLVLGAPIADWQERLVVNGDFQTWIDGELAGAGRPEKISSAPLESVRFMLENAARRGMPLKAGQVISSGAVTGVHRIGAGQVARVIFADCGEISVLSKAPARESSPG